MFKGYGEIADYSDNVRTQKENIKEGLRDDIMRMQHTNSQVPEVRDERHEAGQISWAKKEYLHLDTSNIMMLQNTKDTGDITETAMEENEDKQQKNGNRL